MGKRKCCKKRKTKKQRSDSPEPCHIKCVDRNGSTPIHEACGDKMQHDMLKQLLETDNRVNCKDKHEHYPLLQALLKGCSLEVLQVLLAAGADIKVKDDRERNALHCAVHGVMFEDGDIQVIEELCHRFPELLNETTDYGDGYLTPLEYALDYTCSVDVFEVLWKPHLYDFDLTNFLIYAVKGRCDIKIIDKIMNNEQCKSLVNLPDMRERLPIHYVNCKIVCKRLIEAGSDLFHEDYEGFIPLRYNIRTTHANPEVVSELLKHMDSNKLSKDEDDFNNFSMLHEACGSSSNAPAVAALLEYGYSPIAKCHDSGSAIELACGWLNTKAVIVILKKYPAIFLDCKDLRNKYLSGTGHYFDAPELKERVTNFAQDIIKCIALQNHNLARKTLQKDNSFKPNKCILSYLRKCLAELKALRNFKLTSSKSFHELILEDFMDPTLRTDTKKRRTYWKNFNKANEFKLNNVTIFKDEIEKLQSFICSTQLYNERLCTQKGNEVVFLPHLASERIFDYLDNRHLLVLAYSIQCSKAELSEFQSFMAETEWIDEM